MATGVPRAARRIDQRGVSDEQRSAWLRGWMRAAGLPRSGEKRLFEKFDAWHSFDLPFLRRAFPETPWIFLHRNPVEVIDYAELPDAVTSKIAQHFHLTLSPADIEKMKVVTAFYVKTPSLFFEPDTASKQQETTPEGRDLCARLLDPLHAARRGCAGDGAGS